MAICLWEIISNSEIRGILNLSFYLKKPNFKLNESKKSDDQGDSGY